MRRFRRTHRSSQPRELPPEIAAKFDARLDAIEAQKKAVARLALQLEDTDGMIADVLGVRMDSVWAQMFDDTVALARDVVAERADGFEVAAIVEDLTEDLRVFPERAAETMERLRSKVVFPAADLEPAAFVIADQRLLQATLNVDAVYGSLITYIEIADTLDLDGSAERDYVIDVLEDSAANRSVFLQVALDDVAVLRAAAASLPGNASVAEQATALEARIDLKFTVSYSDDLDKVEQVLGSIVAEHDAVLDEPAPVIKLHELGDSGVMFVVRPWVKTENYWPTYWDLIRTVKDRFDAEGITFPFPQHDVHVVKT